MVAHFGASHFAQACALVIRTRVVWLGVRLRVGFNRLSSCGGQGKPAHHVICTLER